MNKKLLFSHVLLFSSLFSLTLVGGAKVKDVSVAASKKSVEEVDGTQDQVVVTFNMQVVAEGMTKIKDESQRVQREVESQIKSLQSRRADIDESKKNIEKNQASLSKDKLTEEIQIIIAKEEALHKDEGNFQMELQQKSMSLQMVLKEAINESCKALIKENPNYVVLPTEYAQNDKFDISKEIIQIANKSYDATKKSSKVTKASESAQGHAKSSKATVAAA
jgi:hypothetical protein